MNNDFDPKLKYPESEIQTSDFDQWMYIIIAVVFTIFIVGSNIYYYACHKESINSEIIYVMFFKK